MEQLVSRQLRWPAEWEENMDIQTWFLLQQLDSSQEKKQQVSNVQGKYPVAGSD